MKKTWQFTRILSVIIACAICIGMVTVSAAAATTGDNIFANGSFDGGSTAGWTMGASTEVPPTPHVTDYSGYNGGAELGNFSFCNESSANGAFAVTSEAAHTGTYSYKATRAAADGVNYITYYGFGALTEGEEYTLSYYIKGTGNVSFRSYLLGPVENWCVNETVPSADWQKITYTFTAANDTANQGGTQIGFQLISGEGTVYFDDVTLTQEYLEPLTKTTELLANNDFANGTANWNFSGNSAIIDQDGTNVIKMTVPANGSEYIQQTVAVEPGKTYDFAADLMTQEQDGNDAQAQVYAIDSAWNMICPSEYKTYGWKHLTATYTAPAGVTSITILLQHNVVAGVSYWKNISFSLTETVTEAKYENVFVNGDFETVFASDSALGYNITSATAEFTTANVHSGTYAVKYTSGYFTNYATAVEAGTYTLSMWVNTVSGDTAEMSGFVSGCGIPWQDFAMTAVRGVTDG
ncbi:MAG: carbohydrate binding domain-containing protein, partial [Clostridia bacterium]|nr:carbohydrate binding domain-containing protein [Clostridia bacterium]